MQIFYLTCLCLTLTLQLIAAQKHVQGNWVYERAYGRTYGCNNKDSYIQGACTSGRDADCQGGKYYSGIQCASDSSADRVNQLPNGGITGNYDALAKCKKDEFAYMRCVSGRDRDCSYGGRNHAHVLWCRGLNGKEYGAESTTICGKFGESVSCPSGYGVTESCGAGRDSDCDFGACKNSGRVYTQLKCVKIQDISTTEAPIIDALITEAPIIDALITEAPITEAPTAEAPSPTPAAGTPIAEAPTPAPPLMVAPNATQHFENQTLPVNVTQPVPYVYSNESEIILDNAKPEENNAYPKAPKCVKKKRN